MRQTVIVRAVVTVLAFGSAHLLGAQAPRTAPKPAAPPVVAANAAVLGELPFADRQDFEDARRGFIDTTAEARTPPLYGFLDEPAAPDTVNPSLWRLAQLNAINGLFKVAEGVYQVRGFALANMTIIEGAAGVIVVDPLGSVGAAREAIDLYFRHRPRRPVSAVIYTHSHSDHYGGVKGVTTDADVAAGRTSVIAPAGFMEAAVSESVIAGNAMGRRAQYQFGTPLPRNARGNVDAGLGKIDSRGVPGGRSLIAPTVSITQPLEPRTIDGVRFVFQLAPASEAPAEMHFFLPASKVLDLAENATHTLHNLLPLRGTEARDARGWSQYINEALEQFGSDADVLIAQHHWPTWGHERVVRALANQRDLYKYIHDQSVRLMNHGYTPAEVAERLALPKGLASEWSARGYYGTLSHNSKAVYQKYLGWYDGNPANLNALPPEEAGRKAVEYMGGAAAVVSRARLDFARGEYRWVAQVMSQVVHADPANTEARELGADAMEQMGYAAESATWRNAYLLGAQELRNGPLAPRKAALDPDMLHAMSLDLMFDVLGTQVDGTRADGTRIVINWRFTEPAQRITSRLENAALTHVAAKEALDADVTITLPRAEFESVLLGRQTFAQLIARKAAVATGNADKLGELMSLMDEFDASFAIVEPRTARR